MADYSQVTKALEAGVSPSDICSTCPWDRFCIVPPEMTKDDIHQRINGPEDEIADGEADANKAVNQIMKTVFNTILFSGKDTQAQVCPVLVVRMKSSDGKRIADSMKDQMKSWDDKVVTV